MGIKRLCQTLFGIQHDGAGLAQRGKAGIHADGGAKAVQVGEAVPHDEDVIAGAGHLGDGVGHDTRPHLIAFFHAAAGTADEFIPVFLAQGHLATTRARTLLRFSMPLETPPKN